MNLAKWVATPLMLVATTTLAAERVELDCRQLPKFPAAVGVAGPYVGVSGDALIVAGGTNFPEKPPWDGGRKVWHDATYVLERPDGTWQKAAPLPRPFAYGVSLSTDDGLICIGGCDDKQNYADAFILRWNGETLTRHALPDLPHPTSCSAGALIGSRVYIAGGQAGPNPLSGPTHDLFWTLDLSADEPKWEKLPTWPGPDRFYAIAATDSAAFYLFSGFQRVVDEDGQPSLKYLRDAYRYDPATKQWTQLADLPHPNGAVASPAPHVGDWLLLLGGGADGRGIELPLKDRPTFLREVVGYHLTTNQWKTVGRLPFSHVAVPLTQWRGGYVVASGESRPGVRSREVWMLQPSDTDTSATTDDAATD